MGFRKVTDFRKLDWENQPFRMVHQYDTFEEAAVEGRHDACMRGVRFVTIFDNRGKEVASCHKLGNYWFEYKDKNGHFISRSKFFKLKRQEVERYCMRQGFNIRLRGNDYKVKLLAGENVVTLPVSVLPWLCDIADDLYLDSVPMFEGDPEPPEMPEKEKLNLFAETVQKMVTERRKRLEN